MLCGWKRLKYAEFYVCVVSNCCAVVGINVVQKIFSVFQHRPDRPWGPLSLLLRGYRCCLQEEKRRVREVKHSPPCAAVKNGWNCTSAASVCDNDVDNCIYLPVRSLKELKWAWLYIKESSVFGVSYNDYFSNYSFFIYSRTPLIPIKWDKKPSWYAENPDNWMFLLEEATLAIWTFYKWLFEATYLFTYK
jgi:hypothetical protein